eukprot:TRINITY_DN13620_c0_g1_i2.p1 TRINITY_DN13620_c0_g1~~TRINITY_DN13620_c0_g1_i2.p1  ORF type:complete len:142 (+),score=20.24 TRINITY_DN13620_c0_g1_i2:109-534(+)
MALVSRLCAVLATSVWSTLRADALFAERAERGDNDATATDALGRVLVRREPAVRLRANCSSVNGSQPLVAADDGCDCGNSTACVEGQFCLQTASLCFGACSAPAGGGTIDYDGSPKCKCGNVICNNGNDTICNATASSCYA